MILPANTTIFLARHGQSEWNNLQRISGQGNPGLSSRGIEQSAALAECLIGQSLSAIYTSALRRTLDTAQPTALVHGLQVHSCEALNEIHMGTLQGGFRDERDPEAMCLWEQWKQNPEETRPPGGETYSELRGRVNHCLLSILDKHAGDSVLIVGRRGTNRILCTTLMQWPESRAMVLRLRSKYFYRIRLGNSPTIDSYCLTGIKKGCRVDGFLM